MARSGKTIAIRAIGAVMILAFVGGLVWFVARICTVAIAAFGRVDVPRMIQGFSRLWPLMLEDPFTIAYREPAVLAFSSLGLLIPLGLFLSSAAQRGMKLRNEDTFAAHGDSRLATDLEKSALLDTGSYANNTWFSESCGMAMEPHDKATKAILDGRNHNIVTYGTSGLGKTYNLVMPDLMQSTGEAIPYLECGLPAFKAKLAEKMPGNLKRTHGGEGARQMRKAKREWQQAIVDFAAKAPLRKREKWVAPGFDVVNVDPKGDNMRAAGYLNIRGGQTIKCLNLIDPREGDRYNPLANIKVHYTDIKDPETIEVSVKAFGPSSTEAGAPEEEVALEEPITVFNGGGAKGTGPFSFSASLTLDTHFESLGDVPSTELSVEELDERITELEETDPEAEHLAILRKQREVRWIETRLGTHSTPASATAMAQAKEAAETGDAELYGEADFTSIEGQGCSKVTEVMKAHTFRQTKGELTIDFTNLAADPIDARVEIELDPALRVVDILAPFYGKLIPAEDEAGNAISGGKVVWQFDSEKHVPGAGRNSVPVRLRLAVAVEPFRVPDGIDLTKTVDCLVANLKGTDAASNGSEDPFWEDTKRLCFMSLVAYLFECYDEQYRTIPEMMNLLNLALDESGDPSIKSPLTVMMEQWEHAREFVEFDSTRADGEIGYVQGNGWKKASNLPHSREDSLALHCFHAFMSGADDTVRSVIISCQACLVNLLSVEIKDMLSADELRLDTLGDPNQKQVIYMVVPDINSPFEFISALAIFQAIDMCQDKAYKRYGGKLPRHVRFIIDEAPNIGKIPILVRALAVVRSRNISITLFAQSKAQFAAVYGKEGATILEDNCSTVLFLGSQNPETLEEMSKKIGTETVFSKTFQRNFGDNGVTGRSESITSSQREVRTTAQMSHMEKGTIYAFVFNHYAVEDAKFKTSHHPLFAYVYPGHSSSWDMPPAQHSKMFDFTEYKMLRDAGEDVRQMLAA